MNKKWGVIIFLICLLLASTIIDSVNSQIDITNKKMVLDDDEIKDNIKITKPMIGSVCIFGNCFAIGTMISIKRGLVIDSELNVETNTSETFDYVIFTLTYPDVGIKNVTNVYKINVSKYPFYCCFKNIPTRFNYIINATGYKNYTKVAWDEIAPIVFIRISPYDTP